VRSPRRALRTEDGRPSPALPTHTPPSVRGGGGGEGVRRRRLERLPRPAAVDGRRSSTPARATLPECRSPRPRSTHPLGCRRAGGRHHSWTPGRENSRQGDRPCRRGGHLGLDARKRRIVLGFHLHLRRNRGGPTEGDEPAATRPVRRAPLPAGRHQHARAVLQLEQVVPPEPGQVHGAGPHRDEGRPEHRLRGGLVQLRVGKPCPLHRSQRSVRWHG